MSLAIAFELFTQDLNNLTWGMGFCRLWMQTGLAAKRWFELPDKKEHTVWSQVVFFLPGLRGAGVSGAAGGAGAWVRSVA